jgi:hypothetical protein
MKNKKNFGKKGQIHISETILVVFVMVILIIIGVVTYFKFSLEKSKTLEYELSERQATIMLAKIMNLDELACSDEDCIDTAKILPFKRALGGNFERYKKIFGRKKIVLNVLYPEPGTEAGVECDITKYIQVEYPNNCGIWEIYDYNPENELGAKISSIISLYFPEIDKYYVGRLEIEHYGSIKEY